MTWSPSTTPPYSSTRTLSRATSCERQSTSLARSGTLRGPSRAWWPASSAGRPTSRAPISQSPTFTSTTSASSGGPCASRSYCSSATCAWSSALSSSLVISTRVSNVKRQLAILVFAGSLRSKLPSVTPTSHGPLTASHRCGSPRRIQRCKMVRLLWCVSLPESQSQWLHVRHGSVNVVPGAIGVKFYGPNLAPWEVTPPQVCGAQAQTR